MSARKPTRRRERCELHQFTVRGHGEFPIDMLRYDGVVPLESLDARQVELSVTRETDGPTTVRLRGWAPVGIQRPTVGRWESFGWQVISVDGVEVAS